MVVQYETAVIVFPRCTIAGVFHQAVYDRLFSLGRFFHLLTGLKELLILLWE